jgi:hypothetical protein
VASYDAARTSHPENSSTACSLRIGNCLTSVSAASGALGRHHRLARWVADNGDLWRRGRATWPSQPRAMAISTTATLGQVSWVWTHLSGSRWRDHPMTHVPLTAPGRRLRHVDHFGSSCSSPGLAKAAIERGIRQNHLRPSWCQHGSRKVLPARPARELSAGLVTLTSGVFRAGTDCNAASGISSGGQLASPSVPPPRMGLRRIGGGGLSPALLAGTRAQSMGRSFSCQQREPQGLKPVSPSSASEGWP